MSFVDKERSWNEIVDRNTHPALAGAERWFVDLVFSAVVISIHIRIGSLVLLCPMVVADTRASPSVSDVKPMDIPKKSVLCVPQNIHTPVLTVAKRATTPAGVRRSLMISSGRSPNIWNLWLPKKFPGLQEGVEQCEIDRLVDLPGIPSGYLMR